MLSGALFDQGADVLHAPGSDAGAQLHGHGKTPVLDPGPPRGLADGNGTMRGNDGRQPDEPGLGKFEGRHWKRLRLIKDEAVLENPR